MITPLPSAISMDDGKDDAAVIVGIWEGGNIVYCYLTARNDDGVPVHVASARC